MTRWANDFTANESTLNYVLAHEYAHIRRFDAATKLVVIAVLCVHWFNPAAVALVLGVTVAFATSAKDSGSLGSTDSDPISGIISAAEEKMELYTRQEIADQTAETRELLELYAPFGLTYEYETGPDSEIALRMEWQGKPVHSVYDGEKAIWIANSMRGLYLGPDAVDLEAVYEAGKLTGLRETEAQDPIDFKYYVRGEGTITPYDGGGYTSPQETEAQDPIDFKYYIRGEGTITP